MDSKWAASRSFDVNLESLPLAPSRPATRTPSGTGITRRTRRWSIVQRTITRTAEGGWGTGDEHGDAFATHAANTLRTSVALIQRPGPLAVCAINLDIIIAERRGRGIREAMVLAVLGEWWNEIQHGTGVGIDRARDAGC
jgi:hypothetical protein